MTSYKKITIFILIIFQFSCTFKPDCNLLEDSYRNEEECSMIVDVPPRPSSVYFKTFGRTITDGKPCKCKEESRWWATFSDQIEKGDTIVKKKGELVFSIHKKDTVLNFNWECEGKVYK